MSSNDYPALTIEDKNNLIYLEPKARPGLIVEGKTDVQVYERFFVRSSLKGQFEFVIGKSKSSIIEAYNRKQINFPYVILLDSDYDKYMHRCLNSTHIVYTHYYTMENYLTTEPVIDSTRKDFETTTTCINTNQLISELNENLKPYVLFCLIKLQHDGWDFKLEDCSIDRWFRNNHLQVDELINYILTELHKLDSTETKEHLLHLYKTIEDEFDEFDLQKKELISHGKRKLEILFFIFKSKFPYQFSHKDKNSFTIDLLKNISSCPSANNLIKEVEQKLTFLLN
jgi:hypothetical protein